MATKITRRTAMAGTAAAWLASWLLPRAPRAGIDLSRFCDPEASRYDLSRPFRQAARVYATDGRILARVSHPGWCDLAGDAARLPNAEGCFDWSLFDGRGWMPASALGREARRSRFGPACPTCRGKGRIGAGVHECEQCGFNEYAPVWGVDPEPHDCTGWIGGDECPECRGNGHVKYAITLDGVAQFAPHYVDDLLTLPGGEFRVVRLPEPFIPRACDIFLACRFDGGEAILCGLESETTP